MTFSIGTTPATASPAVTASNTPRKLASAVRGTSPNAARTASSANAPGSPAYAPGPSAAGLARRGAGGGRPRGRAGPRGGGRGPAGGGRGAECSRGRTPGTSRGASVGGLFLAVSGEQREEV